MQVVKDRIVTVRDAYGNDIQLAIFYRRFPALISVCFCPATFCLLFAEAAKSFAPPVMRVLTIAIVKVAVIMPTRFKENIASSEFITTSAWRHNSVQFMG
jgi:hypothetical protein